jgi:hypothetical protein
MSDKKLAEFRVGGTRDKRREDKIREDNMGDLHWNFLGID